MNEERKPTPEDRERKTEGADTGESAPFSSSVEYGPFRTGADAKGKKSGNAKKVAFFLSLAILLSATFGFAGMLLGKQLAEHGRGSDTVADGDGGSVNGGTGYPGGSTVVMQKGDADASTMDGSVTDVVESCAQTVVEIIITADGDDDIGGTLTGAGSGVMIATDDRGGTYIVTNNHVVEGNVSSIVVRTARGEQLSATLVGTDWRSDIAVLRVEKTGLPTAKWLDGSVSLKLGQSVIAIGNPLGMLGGSVSRGIISGMERTITVEGVPMTLLQIDAAINPGNSGGGLFDMCGQLVGIVNAKTVATNIEGIGFAIPADHAAAIVTELIENGYVKGRVDLGLELVGSATKYGIPIGSSDGAALPSEKIQSGDYLYSIRYADGTEVKITSLDQYRGVLARLKAGERVTARICHLYSFYGYRAYEVTLTAYEIKK